MRVKHCGVKVDHDEHVHENWEGGGRGTDGPYYAQYTCEGYQVPVEPESEPELAQREETE